jgi:signal transduction histidine kinase
MTAEHTAPAGFRGETKEIAETGSGTPPLLRSASWLLRAIAYVVVTIIAVEDRKAHGGLVISAIAVVGVLAVAWGGIDFADARGHRSPSWLLTTVLVAIGVACGLVTALPGGGVFVAFAIMAAIGAGSDLPIGFASTVVASSILAVEVSYLASGFGSGDVGWPLALIGAVLVGRNRRDARVQSAQAVALVEQSQRTRAEETRVATLDERARIAREIHDLLAHSLGALGIQLEAAVALLTDAHDIDRALPLLDRARHLASSGLEETRQAIEALRTDAPPLPDTLRTLVEGHADQYGTLVDLAITGVPHSLSPDANLALIRVAQEALANAAKHAPSAPVAVVLEYGADATTVAVTNSASFEEPPTSAVSPGPMGANGGYGLAGMRERILLMGGTLTAGQMDRTMTAGQSDSGWTVRARIPHE